MSGNTRASYLKHGWCDVALLASGLGLGRLRILKGLVVNVSKEKVDWVCEKISKDKS